MLEFISAEVGSGVFEIDYINWKGERSIRRIIPEEVMWGSNEWHPEPQLLLFAWDCEKGANRGFAMRDIHDVRYVEPR